MSRKSRKIPISVALRKIQTNRPTTPSAFKDIGLELRWLKTGVFRETYRILNCDLVVKFPHPDKEKPPSQALREGKMHTQQELKRLARLQKFRYMHPYLPTVYHHDPSSGLLVMSYHPPFESKDDLIEGLGRLASMLLRRLTHVGTTDIHSDNVHRRRVNHEIAVLIDLGY